jgi:hypothetical protein
MARSMVTTGPAYVDTPRWAGDYGGRDNLMIGGFKLDPAQFAGADAVLVTVGAAGAAQGAVAVPVAALTGAIPAGTVLYFGGAKVAVLSAPAAAGAVALAVNALPTALVNADAATYMGSTNKYIPSGTAFGRTFAERDALTPFGPAAAGDDEVFLNYFAVEDATHIDDVEFYRPNNVVYENFLPNFATLAAGVKTLIRAKYLCEIGEP